MSKVVEMLKDKDRKRTEREQRRIDGTDKKNGCSAG